MIYDKIYDIHGILLAVERGATAAKSIHLHLSYFEVDKSENISPNIQILAQDFPENHEHFIGGPTRCIQGGQRSTLKDKKFSTEIIGNDKIKVFSKIGFSPHLLIQMISIPRRITLIHGAGISRNGKAFLFPAWSKAGKTTIVSSCLEHGDINLYGDDFVFLSESGILYSYPLPFSVSRYHKILFPRLYSELKNPLAWQGILPVLRYIKTTLRPFLAKFPVFEPIARAIWPQNLFVPIEKLLPLERINTALPLHAITYLTKYTGKVFQIREIKVNDLITKTIGVLYHELQQIPFWQQFMSLASFGIVDLCEHFSDVSKILHSAFYGKICQELLIPQDFSKKELAKILESLVE